MSMQSARIFRRLFALLLGVSTLAASQVASAGDPDSAISKWLGREITIASASISDLMPVGGKLTFVYDSEDNTVRVCTRQSPGQRGQWKMDMTPGCNVALAFTAGERYCTIEDVKAGNAEVLSACHRLRSHDVALRQSNVKGRVELHDVIVFPVQGEGSKISIAILVDSPSRVTDGGILIGHN